jgi:hypothetical protein
VHNVTIIDGMDTPEASLQARHRGKGGERVVGKAAGDERKSLWLSWTSATSVIKKVLNTRYRM